MKTCASLTLPVPCIFESSVEIKIKLHFYFCTSLWCLKILGTTKKCENKNLTYFFSSSGIGMGRVKEGSSYY